jgi:fructosamine-3-kinase
MRVAGNLRAVAAAVDRASGRRLDGSTARPVGGGCIHSAWRLDGGDGPVFLKTNAPEAAWMFEAEADGLAGLAEAQCIRVPAVLGLGRDGDMAWLALEWMECRGPGPGGERVLGERLAALHSLSQARFGWRRDNAIGATPQPNDPDDDWAGFFASRRIGYQLDVAEANGLPGSLIEAGRRLQDAVGGILGGRRVRPALLHGDLWGGNWACDDRGEPFIFDPAVYCGDPEADVAMTRLFGGFGRSFYAAYEAVLPKAPGYATRLALYQLYHVLNHANLFGGGYVGQARRSIQRLLAEARG